MLNPTTTVRRILSTVLSWPLSKRALLLCSKNCSRATEFFLKWFKLTKLKEALAQKLSSWRFVSNKGYAIQRCIKTALKRKEACTQNKVEKLAQGRKKKKNKLLLSETKEGLVKAKFSPRELERKNLFWNNRKGLC